MKNVQLTPFEVEVAGALIDHTYMCSQYCYMGYKKDMCNKTDANGNYRCRFQRAVAEIQKKLGNPDYV